MELKDALNIFLYTTLDNISVIDWSKAKKEILIIPALGMVLFLFL